MKLYNSPKDSYAGTYIHTFTYIYIRNYRSYLRKLRARHAVVTRDSDSLILPVVLYGCEAWPLTLREEHRLRLFENRVLRRIFALKGDEVTGG
jgi:hypothetical protein